MQTSACVTVTTVTKSSQTYSYETEVSITYGGILPDDEIGRHGSEANV